MRPGLAGAVTWGVGLSAGHPRALVGGEYEIIRGHEKEGAART